ncbi:MAG: hypothetical protein C4K49_05740 [Candidatus Thorarchaeota archaeon]|nr:MAG: hypothetical protein C4K49_05740 [Candidatus Thorarchaeota archaeon]
MNQIHAQTYELILEYRSQYYEDRLDEFLDGIAVSDDCRRAVRDALLKPVNVSGTEYSNFMEELTRRISQSTQPVSGRIAETCSELELKRAGHRVRVQYTLMEKKNRHHDSSFFRIERRPEASQRSEEHEAERKGRKRPSI